jgi:hypothetical protein
VTIQLIAHDSSNNIRHKTSYSCSLDQALLATYYYKLQNRPTPFAYKDAAATGFMFIAIPIAVGLLFNHWYLLCQIQNSFFKKSQNG